MSDAMEQLLGRVQGTLGDNRAEVERVVRAVISQMIMPDQATVDAMSDVFADIFSEPSDLFILDSTIRTAWRAGIVTILGEKP